MKAARYTKVLGLAVGERSIVVAEVVAGEAAGRPDARRLAEFAYPDGVAAADPVALGKALGAFLKEQRFAARHAVVGLPAKWLLVKNKEVPPTDEPTIADMLRLQAEGEFSSELKDLVYDYTGKPAGKGQAGAPLNVMLVATPRKYVDLAEQVCRAARLDPVAITTSATALGAATGRNVAKNAVVLTLAAGGAELTAQSGDSPSILRHLRAPAPEAPFISDLRRAVSTIPQNGSARELVVWDGAGSGNAAANRLADSLGMRVRSGDLPSLGVSTTEAASNGGGRVYAPAVALALGVLAAQPLPVDFLHSRLAPPEAKRIAPWMIWAAVAALLLVAAGVYAYVDLQHKEAELAAQLDTNKRDKPRIDVARAFVDKVSFAERWHGTDSTRYIAALLDITRFVPEDFNTYATSIVVREKEEKKADAAFGKANASAAPVPSPSTRPSDRPLTVTFYGKAPTQERAQSLLNRFIDATKGKPRVSEFKSNGIQMVGIAGGGRQLEASFSFSFTYKAPDNPGAR